MPQFFLHIESYFVCELKPHAKFQYPRTAASGRKVTGGRERDQTPLIVATRAQGQRTQLAQTYPQKQSVSNKYLFSHLNEVIPQDHTYSTILVIILKIHKIYEKGCPQQSGLDLQKGNCAFFQ